MKKFWILLFIPFLIGAAPSRQYTYTGGNTILASEVSGNEDAMFNYLQNGVDTYAALSIANADISTTANIQSEKLNLTAIVQAVNINSAGSLTNAGTFTQTGNTTFAGATIANLGTVTTMDLNGGSIDGVTIGAASGPTVTDIDINGGTLDGVNIGTTTATGELIVNDSSDDANGLGSQGTSGQVLTSAGAGANPTWSDAGMTLTSTTSGSGTNTGDITIAASKKYLVTMDIENSTGDPSYVHLLFNSSSTATGYAWYGTGSTFNTTPVTTSDGDDSDSKIALAIASNGYALEMRDSVNNGFIKGHFWIDTNKVGTAFSAFVNGEFVIHQSDGTTATATFGGVNKENLTVTSFELVFEKTTAYTIKLYTLN